jgi:estrogen-related receptor beta like 1
LSRTYFAIKSTQSGDQFIYFSSLCFWLLNICGSSIQGDKKYDDPNTAAQTILMEMKNLGIDSNVPPNKLRTGYGEYVCIILLRLINKALEKRKPTFKKVKDSKEKNDEETNIVDIEEEDMPDMINKEIDYGDSVVVNNVSSLQNTRPDINVEDNDDDETKILHSNIPKSDWMKEVQRIGSKLKIDYLNIGTYNSSEWRSHIEQVKTNDKNLALAIPSSRQVLENLSEDIEKILDKISKKEAMISKNFSKIISDYKGRDHEKNSQLEEFNLLRNKVDKMQKEFEELEDKLGDLNVSFIVI